MIRKIFSPRRLRTVFSFVSVTLILFSYQNCSSVSDSSGGDSSASGGGGTANDALAACRLSTYRYASYTNGSDITRTLSVGFGGQFGAFGPQPTPANYTLNIAQADGTTYVDGSRTVTSADCRILNNNNALQAQNCNINTTNKSVSVRVRPGNNTECADGTRTMAMDLVDGCVTIQPNEPAKNVIINYSNACPSQVTLQASDLQNTAAFGARVSMSGDRVLVVAPEYRNVATGNKMGVAYVYVRQGANFVFQQRLSPNATAPIDGLMGAAVRGNLIAIGAPGRIGTATNGRVYVYEFDGNSTWNLLTTIEGPTPTALPNVPGTTSIQFGFDVEILNSDAIAVSAIGVDLNGTTNIDAGAVYVYTRSGATYTLADTLTAAAPSDRGLFGFDISSSGTTLVVGEPVSGSFESAANYGAVHVFSGAPGSMTASAPIKAAAWTEALAYGTSVATNGTLVAVGAPLSNGSRGAVYVYNMAGTLLNNTTAIVPAQIGVNERFGSSVQLYNGNLYASAPFDEGGFGVVYKYTNASNVFTQSYRLVSRAATRVADSYFGTSFSISGTSMVVGSSGNDVGNTPKAGLAFVIATP